MATVETREIKGRSIWAVKLSKLEAIEYFLSRNPGGKMPTPRTNLDVRLWEICHGEAVESEIIILTDYTAERIVNEINAEHAAAEASREAAQRELDAREAGRAMGGMLRELRRDGYAVTRTRPRR